MKKQENTKQKLFEMMQKVNPELKGNLNEIFGFSKKEKESKQKQELLNKAKEEIVKYNPINLWGQPSLNSTPEDKKSLMKVRINMAKQNMPILSQILPNLFDDNQHFITIFQNINGDNVEGIIPINWQKILIDKNGYLVNEENAILNLNKFIDNSDLNINEDMSDNMENIDNDVPYSEWNELQPFFQKNEFTKSDIITILKKIYDNVYQEDKQKLMELLNQFGYEFE